MTGSAGTMERILTQIDSVDGEMWLDEQSASLSEVQSFLGDAYEEDASGKLIIIGGDSGNDPASEQSVLIQYVG